MGIGEKKKKVTVIFFIFFKRQTFINMRLMVVRHYFWLFKRFDMCILSIQHTKKKKNHFGGFTILMGIGEKKKQNNYSLIHI